MTEVGRRRLMGLGIAGLVFALDQLMKWYLVKVLHLMERGMIGIHPLFDLTYARNYGVSFSFLQASSIEMRIVLVLLTAAIATGVLFWMLHERAMAEIGALGLVLGGALGNILDRATDGYVTDYADLHFGDFRPFAIFNLADAAISIGVVIILARSFLSRDKRGAETGDPAARSHSEN